MLPGITIGDRMREAMKRAGLTRAATAALCDCSPPNIANWTQNRSYPPLPRFVAFCDATRSSADEILGIVR